MGTSPLPAAFFSARASSLCFFSCFVSGRYLCASLSSCVAGNHPQFRPAGSLNPRPLLPYAPGHRTGCELHPEKPRDGAARPAWLSGLDGVPQSGRSQVRL